MVTRASESVKTDGFAERESFVTRSIRTDSAAGRTFSVKDHAGAGCLGDQLAGFVFDNAFDVRR